MAPMLCAVVVRNRAAARHLADTVAESRAATAHLRRLLATPGADPAPAARQLAALLLALGEAYDVAGGEAAPDPAVTDELLGVEREARLALAAARSAQPRRSGRKG